MRGAAEKGREGAFSPGEALENMKRIFMEIKCLCLALLLFALGACSNQNFKTADDSSGTERDPTDIADDEIQDSNDAAARLAIKICERVVVCDASFTKATCYQNVMAATGVAPEIGFNNYSTLNEVFNDSAKIVNEQNVTSCLNEIGAVTCGSQTMTYFLNGLKAGNYTTTGDLIGGTSSCGSIGTGGNGPPPPP